LKDAVCHQIITHLYKTIFIKKYYSTETDSFISIADDDDNSVLGKLLPIINTHKYFVSCIGIAQLLIRTHPLYIDSINQTEFGRVNDLIGYVGTIRKTKIMTNHVQSLDNRANHPTTPTRATHYNKYPKNLISLFNGIELNLEISEIKKIENYNLTVDFKYDYLIRNPKYYFLIENENSLFYPEFLSFHRESKITKILN
jgi:hypothetical protein